MPLNVTMLQLSLLRMEVKKGHEEGRVAAATIRSTLALRTAHPPTPPTVNRAKWGCEEEMRRAGTEDRLGEEVGAPRPCPLAMPHRKSC